MPALVNEAGNEYAPLTQILWHVNQPVEFGVHVLCPAAALTLPQQIIDAVSQHVWGDDSALRYGPKEL